MKGRSLVSFRKMWMTSGFTWDTNLRVLCSTSSLHVLLIQHEVNIGATGRMNSCSEPLILPTRVYSGINWSLVFLIKILKGTMFRVWDTTNETKHLYVITLKRGQTVLVCKNLPAKRFSMIKTSRFEPGKGTRRDNLSLKTFMVLQSLVHTVMWAVVCRMKQETWRENFKSC